MFLPQSAFFSTPQVAVSFSLLDVYKHLRGASVHEKASKAGSFAALQFTFVAAAAPCFLPL